VTPEVIQGALARYERALAPAGFEAMAVLVLRLLEFAATFGIKCPDQESAAAIYSDALSDLPPDLLSAAINRTVQTWQWGNRLPMPAEVRAAVTDDLARRQREKSRLELALMQLQAGRPYISDFDRRWREFMATTPPEALPHLPKASPRDLKRIEAATDDFSEPADRTESIRRGLTSLAGFRLVPKAS